MQQLEHPYRAARFCPEVLVAEHGLVDFYHTVGVPAIKGPEAIFEDLVQLQPLSGYGEQVCFQLAWITGPLRFFSKPEVKVLAMLIADCYSAIPAPPVCLPLAILHLALHSSSLPFLPLRTPTAKGSSAFTQLEHRNGCVMGNFFCHTTQHSASPTPVPVWHRCRSHLPPERQCSRRYSYNDLPCVQAYTPSRACRSPVAA